MAAAAAAFPLTEVVKKVDGAVARIEQLQRSIIKSRDRHVDGQRARQEKLFSAAEEADMCRVRRRESRSLAVKEGKRSKSGFGNQTASSNKRVPDIVKGSLRNEENVQAKKKWQKKSSISGPAMSPFSVGKLSPPRKVLESRQINVFATEPAFPSPLSADSDTKQKENKHVKASDKENKRFKVSDASSNGRPPWKNVNVISTDNRYAATIAERVRTPLSAKTGVHHHLATDIEAGKSKAGAFPTGKCKAERSESLACRKIESRPSLPAMTSIRPSPAQEDIDLAKSFCVDVRPDLNRPWKLAQKMSSSARPLVMFPNPAFRPYAERRPRRASPRRASPLPQASPKLTPFRSFQLRPLKLSSLQHPLLEQLPATIRPYLSPSKSSPRQSQPRKETEEEDPLESLICSKAQPEPSPYPRSTIKSTSSKKPSRQSMPLPLQKESWLCKRLSLPFSSSSRSFIKRFSMSQSSTRTANTSMNCPDEPLPSLITRLPTVTKPASMDFKLAAPLPRLAKSQSNSISATPLVSPLPLPPALRVLTSRTSNRSSRSSSCHLHAENGVYKNPRENCAFRGNSRGAPPDDVELKQKKTLPVGSFGSNRGSMWPSMRQSYLSSQPESLDCSSHCTGTGPYLFKHVKRWMPNKTAGPHANKGHIVKK